MKRKTEQLSLEVQEALLDMPPALCFQMLQQWIEAVEESAVDLTFADGWRFILGYRLQSSTTGSMYDSWEALNDQEPDPDCVEWLSPTPDQLHAHIAAMQPVQFYHQVLPLVNEALDTQALSSNWGYPPSSWSDGYQFMAHVARYLRFVAEHPTRDWLSIRNSRFGGKQAFSGRHEAFLP